MTGYLWDPAGPDTELATARTDLLLGRWTAALNVLAHSRTDWGLRAHRSLVLGSAAADSDVAEQGLRERPADPDARLLAARAMSIRALRLKAAGSDRAAIVGQAAEAACHAAAETAADDPTPLVVLLALAPLGYRHSADPYGLGVAGPWDLWQRIAQIDPAHREGHRRLLNAVITQADEHNPGRAHAARAQILDTIWRVANWASATLPADSDPQLLYLVALVEEFRRQGDGALWRQPGVLIRCAGLTETWFRRAAALTGPRLPVADLMLLSHALTMAGPQLELEARHVLRAVLPYAHRYPWELFGDPAAQLDAACRQIGIQPP